MKGVFIFNPSSDIAFIWSDENLIQHFAQIAKSVDQNALTEDGELDQNFVLQYLTPFIVSQTALIENLKNSYRSVVGTNGVRFTFSLFDDHIYMAISSSDCESEAYQRRKLSALHRIVTCLVGPVVSEIKPDTISKRAERWNTIGNLLEAWCSLYESEQGFLAEAVESLHVNTDLIGRCVKFLENTVNQMLSVDGQIVHSLLIVERKLLACYSNVQASPLDSADIQMFILLAHAWFSDTDRELSQRSGNSTPSSVQVDRTLSQSVESDIRRSSDLDLTRTLSVGSQNTTSAENSQSKSTNTQLTNDMNHLHSQCVDSRNTVSNGSAPAENVPFLVSTHSKLDDSVSEDSQFVDCINIMASDSVDISLQCSETEGLVYKQLQTTDSSSQVRPTGKAEVDNNLQGLIDKKEIKGKAEKESEQLSEATDSFDEAREHFSGSSVEPESAVCNSGKLGNTSGNYNLTFSDKAQSQLNFRQMKSRSMCDKAKNTSLSRISKKSTIVNRSFPEFDGTLKSKLSVIRSPEREDSNSNNKAGKSGPVSLPFLPGRSSGVSKRLSTPRIESDLVNASPLRRNIVKHQVTGRSWSVASEDPQSTDDELSRRGSGTPSTLESSAEVEEEDDWVKLDDVELCYRKLVVFLRQRVVEQKAKPPQKPQQYMVPHVVQCVLIVPGVELILVSQIPDVKHSEALLQLLDYCQRLISDANLSIISRMETCVKKLSNVIQYSSTLVTSQWENLNEHWQKIKALLQNREVPAVKTESAGVSVLNDDMERTVHSLRRSARSLFHTLFFMPRGQTEEELKTCLKQIDTISKDLQLSLLHYHDYLTFVARNGIPFSAYLQMFPGLLHFIFVDRQSGSVLAPSLNSLVAEGATSEESRLRLKKQIWQLMEQVESNLSLGYTGTAQRVGAYYCTYSLWFENFLGDRLTPGGTQVATPGGTQVVTPSTVKPSGCPVIDQDFYKRLLDESFAENSSGVQCYEMLCVFDSVLTTNVASVHCVGLAQKIRDHMQQLSPRINVL